MTEYRWERERSAYLLAHSKPGGTLRRRSGILGRDVRRGSRAGAGVESAAVQDEVTPDLWRRLTRDPATGERGRRVRYGLAAAVVAVAVGPGIALGVGCYKALVRVSPRIGRLWWWPWALAAAALAVVLVLAGVPVGVGLRMDRHFPLSLLHYGPWWAWLAWQTTVAVGVLAFEIWAWGWPGVPKGAVPKSDRNADGSFREIDDSEKFRLDTGGDPDYVPPAVEDDDAADALNDGYPDEDWPDEDWPDEDWPDDEWDDSERI